MDLTRHSWVFQPPPLQPDCTCALDVQEPDYIFKIADSGNELLQAFHLLYQEYRSSGYVQDKPDKLLFTRHHLLPNTTVFVAKSENTVLSTATLVRDSHHSGLPMDDLYGPELETLRRQNRSLVEVCSLASDRQFFSRSGTHHFVSLVYYYFLYMDVDDVCIMVNPKHVRLYKSLFGFEVFGEEKHYPRVNAPAVALRVDTAATRKKLTCTDHDHCFHDTIKARYRSMQIDLCSNVLNNFRDDSPATADLNPLNDELILRMRASKMFHPFSQKI